MFNHCNQPHISPSSAASVPVAQNKKVRGSYNCGRCGLPKKGHVCPLVHSQPNPPSTPSTADSYPVAAPTPTVFSVAPSSSSSSRTLYLTPPASVKLSSNLRRALSFEESADLQFKPQIQDPETEELSDDDLFCSEYGRIPASCMWVILCKLPPSTLLAAARVCKGWRDTTRKIWKSAEELRLKVANRAQIGFVGSVIQKCPNLTSLTLRFESDVDATVLAWVAFSCPNLESLEISTASNVVNRINGDELSRFVADKRCLTTLKMEGCSNLGGLVLCSSSLLTVWLADISSLTKMVFNCPNMKEMSMSFSSAESNSTDLVTGIDGLVRSCPKLQNLHIASQFLCHSAVLALASANLRWLRMLSLVLGTQINDASVAAIVSSYPKLELLDLSGSSISDSGIGMICNELPKSLSKLLLALCSNITSSGIQFATTQLPLLELMDCGMTISDPLGDLDEVKSRFNAPYQKLIIKHSLLKKLSLWGCSGLDAIYLNCPRLVDLNLNACKHLISERVVLECPNLETVYASDCKRVLVDAIEGQMSDKKKGNLYEDEFCGATKRLPDGSKRVLPYQYPVNAKRLKATHCRVIH